VVASILVDVAGSQPVPVSLGARRVRLADLQGFPGFGGIAPRAEVADLSFGLVAEDHARLAVAQQVGEDRCFIAGAAAGEMLFPVSGLALGVLVPMERLAWKADDDDVGPAVLVDVPSEVGEAVAVSLGSVVDGPGLAKF